MVLRPAAAEALDVPIDLTPDPIVVEAKAAQASKLIPVLLPYQQAWVSDSSPVKVCVKSRRIGISWAVACEAVFVASRKREQQGMDVWYLSQSERDAKEFVRDCATWARAVDMRLQQKGDSRSVQDGPVQTVSVLCEDGKSVLATQIKFTSGHRITILPGKNPDVLRGKQGYVIFDEAALLDLAACLAAAQALNMSMRPGRIAFISTQRGEGNAFNKLVMDVRARKRHVRRYTLHEYRLRDAINDGYYRRRCVMQGTRYSPVREQKFFDDCMAEVGAAQEYDCIAARDGEQYLPRDLIEQCQRAGRPRIALDLETGWELKGTPTSRTEHVRKWCERELAPHLAKLVKWEHHFVGWDFGRSAKGDLSVCLPLALRDDKDLHKQIRSVPFIVEMHGVPFKQQEEVCKFVIDRLPNFGAAKFDATGNGSSLAEYAQQTWGEKKVEAIKFGAGARQWFEVWMPLLKALMQQAELELPNYTDLTLDLEQFALDDSVPILPKKRTKGGNGEQRHGDAGIALVLAVAASKVPTISMRHVGAVPSRSPIRAM